MAAGRWPVLKPLGWGGKGLGCIVYTPWGPNLTPKNSWPPPWGGTETVFRSFLSPGRLDQADSFWTESEISCIKFRQPTKGIPAEKMLDPPQRGGQTLVSGVFSALEGQIRLIPFGTSQKSPASCLGTPTKGIPAEKCLTPPQGGNRQCLSLST